MLYYIMKHSKFIFAGLCLATILIIVLVITRRSSCLSPAVLGGHSCPPHHHSGNDPRVFGPILWPALFLMAVGYPAIGRSTEVAPPIYRLNAIKFIRSLPFLLPCGGCGYNLHQFIQTRDLREDTRTKTNFIRFFVDAYNNIIYHINRIKVRGKLLPPRRFLTVAGVKAKYTCIDTCVTDPRHWDIKDLSKSIKESPEKYLSDMK